MSSVRNKRCYFLFFALFLMNYAVFSQIATNTVYLTKESDNGKTDFYHLKNKGNIEQNSITFIAQDSIGQMWFASKDGLIKYNTKNFIIYKNNPENPHSIGGNFVERIFVGKDGSVWVGTEPAVLSKYRPETDDFESIAGISGGRIKGIQQDKNGIYWITSNKTLYRYDDATKELKSYTYKDDKVGLDRLLITSKNQLFVTTNEHYILEFDTKSHTFDKIQIIDKNEKIHGSNTIPFSAYYLEEDLQGYIWVTTPYGYLKRYNPKNKKLKKYVFQKLLKDDVSLDYDKLSIMFITKDDENNLWFGTWFNGMYKILANRKEVVHYLPHNENPNTLSNNIIHSGFQDKAGYMWFGTEFAGINILKKNKKFDIISFDPNNPDNALPNTVYTSVAIDNADRVWIGTDEKGIFYFNKENPHIIKSANSIFGFKKNTWITSLFYDSKGFLWIGASSGLYKYHPKTKDLIHFTYNKEDYHSLGCNQILCIGEDKNGNIWIGTTRGLSKYNPKNNKFYRFSYDKQDPNSLSNNVVRALYFDSNNTLWVGTFDGLNKFNATTGNFRIFKHNYKNAKSIGVNKINSLIESDGYLWVGTQGAGLNRMDLETEEFQSYYSNTGFPSDNVKGIIKDTHNNLWLSTSDEIIKYNPTSKELRRFGKSDGLENKMYIKNLGLQELEFYRGFTNKDSEGFLYFGGVAGITFFHPDSLPQNTFKPPMLLNEFLVNGKQHPITNKITLRPKENHLEFSTTTLNYIQSDKNKYAFFLKNYDSAWQFTESNNKIEYFNLKKGNYEFYYKGANNDNVWSEASKPIYITILPVFYQTKLFYTILIAIVFLLFLSFFLHKRYIQNKIKKQREQLRYSSSNLSTQRAEQINKTLESKLNNTELYLESDLTLHKLAKILDVRPNYLSQVINQIHSRNFNEFINLYRIEEAKKLLINTSLKIEDIAYDSGFNSLSTFNSIFKKEVGLTPSKFRKQHTE